MPIVPMTRKPEDSLYPEKKIEINPLSYLNTPDTATEAEFAVAVDELAKLSPFGIRETGDYSQFGADNAKDAFFNLRKATIHGIESLSDDESRAWFDTDPEDIETRYRIASENLPPSTKMSLTAGTAIVSTRPDVPFGKEYDDAPDEIKAASDRLRESTPVVELAAGEFYGSVGEFDITNIPAERQQDYQTILHWRDRQQKQRTIGAYNALINAKNTLRRWAMMRPLLSDEADNLLQHIMADKPRDDVFDAKFMALPDDQQEVVMMLGYDLRNTPDKNLLRDIVREFLNGGKRLFVNAGREARDIWMLGETDREDFQKQAEIKARMEELWAPKRSQEYGYWEDAIIGAIGSLPYTGFTMAAAMAGVPEVGLGVISLSMAHQFKQQIALQGGDVTDPKVLVLAQVAGIAYWGIEQAQVGTWMKSMTDLERRMATATFAKNIIPSIYKAEARAKVRQVAPKLFSHLTGDLLKEWLYEEEGQDLLEEGFVSWGIGEDVARNMAEQAVESLQQNFGTMLLMTAGFSGIGAARTGLSRKHTDQELYDAMHHRAQLIGSLHQRTELREKLRKGEEIDQREMKRLERDIDYQRRVLSTMHRAFNKAGGMEDAESAFQRMGLDPRQSFLAAYMFDQERRAIMGDTDLTQAEKEELLGKQATSLSLLRQAYPGRTFTENPDGTFTSSYTLNGAEVREIHQTGTIEWDPASPEGATSAVEAVNLAEKDAALQNDETFPENAKGMTVERWLNLTPEARNEIVQALKLHPEGNFIFTAKMAGSPDVAQVDENQVRRLSGEITLSPDAAPSATFHEDLHAFVRYLRETGELTPQDIQKLREEFGDPRQGVNEDFNEENAAETVRRMQSRSVRHVESTGAEAIMDKVFDVLDRIDLFRRKKKQAETVAENLMAQMRRGEWTGVPVGTITEAQRQKNAQLREKAKRKPRKQAKKPQEPAAEEPEQAQETSGAEIRPEGQDGEKPTSQVKITPQGEGQTAEEAAAEAEADEIGAGKTGEVDTDQPLGKGEWRAVTPKGNVYVRGEWVVVDMDDLKTSDQAGYDQSIQPRDRGTVRSRAQIHEIARKLNPAQLLDSARTDDGAPVMMPDRSVVSGNGRVMAMREARAIGNIAKYEAVVRRKAAELGIAIPSEIQNPVLVRRLDSIEGPSTIQQVAELSNQPVILQRSEAEIAESDAKSILDNGLLRLFQPGADGNVLASSNMDFINGLVQATGDASLVDSNNRPTDATRNRIRRALLAMLVGTGPDARAIVRGLVEDAKDLGMKTEVNGIVRASPDIVTVARDKPQYSLLNDIGLALRMYMDMKREGSSPFQADLFGRPDAVDKIVKAMWGRSTISSIAAIFSDYATRARLVDTSTGGLGLEKDPTKEELLQRAIDSTGTGETVEQAQQKKAEEAAAESPEAPPPPTQAEKASSKVGTPAEQPFVSTLRGQALQGLAEGDAGPTPPVRGGDDSVDGDQARFSVTAAALKRLNSGAYKEEAEQTLRDLRRIPSSLKPYVERYNDPDDLISLAQFAGWKRGPKVATEHRATYRPAVRLKDGRIAWHPRARMHSEALSMWLEQQGIPLEAFDIDEYYGDGGLGPDGRYYEQPMIGDGPTDFEEQREQGRYSVKANRPIAPAFYSQLRRVIEAKVPNKATVAQVRATIDPQKGSGVKQDEIFWSGLQEFLDSKKPTDTVTKEEVLAATQEVVVQDVVKGGNTENNYFMIERNGTPWRMAHFYSEADAIDSYMREGGGTPEDDGYEIVEYGERPEGETTKFASYQLPGGENYREILLTLPKNDVSDASSVAVRIMGKPWKELDAGERRELWKRISENDRIPYKSPHFSEPNIVAHVRFNERTDANGKRTLFIEEIQSDWAQSIRTGGNMVPDAPYVTKTDAWVSLALKRMVRWAAENGFDQIAWTTGEQQAERYDLSKQVDSIKWAKTTTSDAGEQVSIKAIKNGQQVITEMVSPDKVADYIGKELAKQIVESSDRTGEIKGDNLKVGGEGMKSFYDQIVPNIANKLFKRFGAKTDEAWFDLGDPEDAIGPPPDYMVDEGGFTAHALPVTPAMRESVLYEGQARFSVKANNQGDAEYMAAVERGDMATAQRIVDEAALANIDLSETPPTSYLAYADQYGRPIEGARSFDDKGNRLPRPNYLTQARDAWFYKDNDARYAWSIGDQAIFYRAGGLPESGRSYNFREQFYEKGVSVYPTPQPTSFAGAAKEGDWYFGAAEVVDRGSDGEPVVRIISKWVKYPKDTNPLHAVRKFSQFGEGESVVRKVLGITDVVMRDPTGRIIPPSERFQTDNPDIRFSIRAHRPMFGSANRAIASLAVQHLMGEKLDTERAERAAYLFGATGASPDLMIESAKKLAESKVAQEAKKHIENRDPNAAHNVMSQQAEYDSIVALRTGMKSGLKMGQEAERAKQAAEKKLLLNARGEDLQQFIIDTGIDWTETLLSSLPEAFAEWEKARKDAEEKAKKEGAPEGPQQEPEAPPADPAELEARDKRMRELVAAVRAWGDAERAKREKEADDRRKKEQERIEKGESGEEADDTDADPGGEQAEGMEPEGLVIPKELLQAHGVDIRNAQEVAHLIRIWMADWLVRQSKGRLTHQTVWKDREAVEKYRKTMVAQLRDMANGMVEQGWSMTVIHNRISDIPSVAKPDTVERRTASIIAMIQAHSIRQTRAQLITDIRKNIKKKAIKGKRHDALNEDLERKINSEQELTARYLRRILTWSPEKVDAEIVAIQTRLKERTELYNEQNPDVKVALDVEFHRDLMRLRVLQEWGGLKRLLPAQIKQAGIAIDGWLVSAQERLYRRWWAMEEQIGKLVTALHDAIVPDDPEQARIEVGKVSQWISDNVATVRQRLEGLIRQQHDPVKRQAAQAAIDEIMFILSRGTEVYCTVAHEYRQAFVDAVNEIAGGKSAATAYMKHLEEEIPIEVAEQVSRQGYNGRGGGRIMTYNQALQLYASITQRGYASNVKLHKREEHAALLESIFTTEDLALIARLREMYEERRGRLSEVVQEVSGMLVWRPDPLYMPVRVKMPKKGGFQSKGDPSMWMPLARSLTPRVHHGLDFDEGATLTGTFYDATEDAARAIGFGTRGLVLRGVLGNSAVQEAADRYYGGKEMADLNQQVVQALDGFGRTDQDTTHGMLRTVRELNAYAALSWNPLTALKQTVSFPVFAMALEGGFSHVMSAIKDFDRDAMREIMESDGFKARYQGGFMPEVAEILADGRSNIIARFYKLGMTTVQIGDFVPSLLVAPGLYKARLAQNLADDMDEATAKERAMTWTWEIIESTQQSSRTEMLPKFYRQTGAGSEAMKLILQFSSAPLLQLSHEYHAARDWRAGVEGAGLRLGRAILVNHIIIPQMLEMVTKMFYWLIGRDEPEDANLFWAILNGATIGAVNRIMIAGILADVGYNALVHRKVKWGGQMVPAESLMRTTGYGMMAIGDLLRMPFDDEATMEQFQADLVRTLEGMLAPFRYGKEFYDNRIAQ